jgi:hypothetical protein
MKGTREELKKLVERLNDSEKLKDLDNNDKVG